MKQEPKVARAWGRSGADRLAAEAARVEAMLRDAAPPLDCGPEIPVAPARGPFRVFEPRATAPGGRLVHDGYRGPGEAAPRKAVSRLDAFDVMMVKARGRSKDAPPLFTAAQVKAGRDYAALSEKRAACGMSGSSLEVSAARVRGSGQGSRIDAMIAERQRLDRMIAAIGTGYAIAPSQARQHMDRGKRFAIPMRALVDGVCLRGLTIGELVQDGYGWRPTTKTVAAVRAALCAALDRMYDCRAC